MDTRNILLNRSLVVPPYGQVSLNHSTYQGPSLRTHQLDKYDYPLSMRTYLHLGGRVLCSVREGSAIFTFWHHVVGDYGIVT